MTWHSGRMQEGIWYTGGTEPGHYTCDIYSVIVPRDVVLNLSDVRAILQSALNLSLETAISRPLYALDGVMSPNGYDAVDGCVACHDWLEVKVDTVTAKAMNLYRRREELEEEEGKYAPSMDRLMAEISARKNADAPPSE